jgi:hypothetical protein
MAQVKILGLRKKWLLHGLRVLAATAWLAGCGAEGPMGKESGGGNGDGDGDGDGDIGLGDGDHNTATGGFGFGGSGMPNLPPLPEEVEDDSSYRAPVATGRFLWSTNPVSGRVALINVVDQKTQILSAGLYPTFLTSIGTEEDPAALVLNVGSSDATRFRVDGDDVLKDRVDTHAGANRWSRSASGKFAVAWSRPERGVVLDPTDGFQEITVISLSDDGMESTRLVVGTRPRHVQVSSDEERLIVVSEEGINLIDLTDTPSIYDWINLGLDFERRDVSIDADGNYALVRRTDESSVELIDLLAPENRTELTFAGPVTDLDLAQNGRAVAVIRSRSEIATFMLDEVVSDPTAVDTLLIPGEVFGSSVLTDDGSTAVLYTTALANSYLNIVDLRQATYLAHRSLDTYAPVFSVIPTPDGKHAAVLAAEDFSLGETARPAEAFSLIALRSELFPRVVGTGAPVKDVALGNTVGLVTATKSTATGTVHEAHLIKLPSLSVKAQVLSTEPLSAGVLPDFGLAYAAQLHPEGRVTFFDFDTGKTRTLTGFELAAGVVDE